MNFRVFYVLPVAEYLAIFQNFHPGPKVHATMCKNVQQWTGKVKIRTGPREKNKSISEVSVTERRGVSKCGVFVDLRPNKNPKIKTHPKHGGLHTETRQSVLRAEEQVSDTIINISIPNL